MEIQNHSGGSGLDPPERLDFSTILDLNDAAAMKALEQKDWAQQQAAAESQDQAWLEDFGSSLNPDNPADMAVLEGEALEQRWSALGQMQLDDAECTFATVEAATHDVPFWSRSQEATLRPDFASSIKREADEAAVAPQLPSKGPISMKAGTDGQDLNRPSPYEAAAWMIQRLHIASAYGLLWFFDGHAFIPQSRDEAKRKIMDACRPAVESAGTARFIGQVFDCLMVEPRICRDAEIAKNAVAFNDCLMDLDTGAVLIHSPDVFVTTRLKASYYKGLRQDCPVFKDFLHAISCGDAVLQQRIWQAVGYLLAPDQRGKAFIFFQGVPNSGKSVLGNFIQGCFAGDVISALQLNDLAGRFDLHDLVGKKLCLDLDLPADPFNKKAVSAIKKLTGGDLISTDVKFADRVRFASTAKFLFGSNHRILLPNKDVAFSNRLILIPFSVSVEKAKQDFHLLEKLERERDAIIVQALQHYADLRENSYQFAGDFRPNAVLGDTAETQTEAVARFLELSCEAATDVWTSTDVLYTAFTTAYGCLCDVGVFSKHLLRLCQSSGCKVKKARERVAPSANPIYGFKGLKLKKEILR